MSSGSDKTKNKLMETMRMTKADSNKKVDGVNTKQAAKPQNDKPVKKIAKKSAPKKTAKVGEKSSAAPCFSSRRVWPD